MDFLAKRDALTPVFRLKRSTEGNQIGTDLGASPEFFALDAAKIDGLLGDGLGSVEDIVCGILAHLMFQRLLLDLHLHLAKLEGGVFFDLLEFLLLGFGFVLLAQPDSGGRDQPGDTVLDFRRKLFAQRRQFDAQRFLNFLPVLMRQMLGDARGNGRS